MSEVAQEWLGRGVIWRHPDTGKIAGPVRAEKVSLTEWVFRALLLVAVGLIFVVASGHVHAGLAGFRWRNVWFELGAMSSIGLAASLTLMAAYLGTIKTGFVIRCTVAALAVLLLAVSHTSLRVLLPASALGCLGIVAAYLDPCAVNARMRAKGYRTVVAKPKTSNSLVRVDNKKTTRQNVKGSYVDPGIAIPAVYKDELDFHAIKAFVLFPVGIMTGYLYIICKIGAPLSALIHSPLFIMVTAVILLIAVYLLKRAFEGEIFRSILVHGAVYHAPPPRVLSFQERLARNMIAEMGFRERPALPPLPDNRTGEEIQRGVRAPERLPEPPRWPMEFTYAGLLEILMRPESIKAYQTGLNPRIELFTNAGGVPTYAVFWMPSASTKYPYGWVFDPALPGYVPRRADPHESPVPEFISRVPDPEIDSRHKPRPGDDRGPVTIVRVRYTRPDGKIVEADFERPAASKKYPYGWFFDPSVPGYIPRQADPYESPAPHVFKEEPKKAAYGDNKPRTDEQMQQDGAAYPWPKG